MFGSAPGIWPEIHRAVERGEPDRLARPFGLAGDDDARTDRRDDFQLALALTTRLSRCRVGDRAPPGPDPIDARPGSGVYPIEEPGSADLLERRLRDEVVERRCDRVLIDAFDASAVLEAGAVGEYEAEPEAEVRIGHRPDTAPGVRADDGRGYPTRPSSVSPAVRFRKLISTRKDARANPVETNAN